jgi:hypothetical protein
MRSNIYQNNGSIKPIILRFIPANLKHFSRSNLYTPLD